MRAEVIMKILSISIAAYNIEAYLAEILDKFLEFKDKERIEVLIVNDGSKDRTSEIAKKYAEQYPNIFKLINKENGGWGSTVNFGIENASGKYFKLLDGDDYYNVDNLSGFIGFLENCTSDMVITPYRLFNDKTLEVYPKRPLRDEYDIQERFGLEKVSTLFAMHEVCFKTDLLRQSPMNISEHCFYTDVEYVAKAMCRVASIEAYDREIYMYRVAREGQSDSLEGRIKHYKDHLHVVNVLAELRKNYGENSEQYRLISERLHGMIKRQCNIFLSMPSSNAVKIELMEYDKWVRYNCSDLYAETSRTMKILRSSKFIPYSLIAKTVRLYEKRKA